MHRTLMQQMDLAHIEEHSPGMVYWHPNGTKIYNLIQSYIREVHEEHGYLEVRTPALINKSLFETSGHWEKFRENLFTVIDDEKIHVLRAMSCPNHVQLYSLVNRSYRDLPLRYFEFGSVYRNEPSGSMHGITRVRNFFQDDSHDMCRESQILQEVKNYMGMVSQVYTHFGFDTFDVKLSTRPEKRFGTDETWDKAENALSSACDELGIKYEIQPGEGAFYGPKLEIVLTDSHGRKWQMGTIQVDYVLTERFNLTYINEEGKPERPILLHHAVLGSIERWIGILLEHHSKFPIWLSPVQVVITPISEKSLHYSETVYKYLKQNRIRCVHDVSNQPISNKIAVHSAAKVPLIAVVGEREADANTISVRKIGEKKSTVYRLAEFVDVINSL